MALPSPRNKILPLRGLKASLDANLAEILEGEFCYATDQDQYYQKEDGALVAVGASKAELAAETEARVSADQALQDQIDTNADNNTTLEARVTQNEADISTNASAISAEVDARILADQALQDQIDTNSGNNTSLEARVTQNEADIATNAEGISTNASDIATEASERATGDQGLQDQIDALVFYDDTVLAGRVTQNEADIATNATNISTNAANIAANTGNISTNATDISTINDTLLVKADLVDGVIPTSQIPAVAITEFLGSVDSEAEMLALTGQPGDWCLRTDVAIGYVIIGADPALASNWEAFTVPGSAVTSINGQVGTVVLGASDVGAATAEQGALADSAIQPGDNVSELNNDAGYITTSAIPATPDLQAVTSAGNTTTLGATFGGIVEAPLHITTNKTPTTDQGIEIFYAADATGGPAGVIQAYDRDNNELERLKLSSKNWSVDYDGAATFGNSLFITPPGNTKAEVELATTLGSGGVIYVRDGNEDRTIELNGSDGSASFSNGNVAISNGTNGEGKLEIYRTGAAADNSDVRDAFVMGVATNNMRGVLQTDGSLYLSDSHISNVENAKTKIKGDGSAEFSNNVGIGTTDPGSPLTIESSEGNQVKITYPSIASYYLNVTSGGDFAINKDGAERVHISSSGDVGIGGTATNDASATTFQVTDGTTARMLFESTGVSGRKYGWYTSVDGQFALYDYTAGAERMRIDSSGRLLLGRESATDGGQRAIIQHAPTTNSPSYLSLNSGSVSNSGVVFGDTDEDFQAGVLYNHSDEALRFFKFGFTEAARIDSSGNLGIGTSDPEAILHTKTTAAAGYVLVENSSGHKWVFGAADATYAQVGGLYGAHSGLAVDLEGNVGIGTIAPGGNLTISDSSTFTLDVKANGGEGALLATVGTSASLALGTDGKESFKITNAGEFQTGAPGANAAGGWKVFVADNGSTSQRGRMAFSANPSCDDTQEIMQIHKNNVEALRITVSGNVTNKNNSYGALSDAKLKENIVDASSQWEDLKAVQVRNYDLVATGEHHLGVVAQEIEQVSPGLVNDTPDRDEEGNDLGTVTKSVNYSVLYMKAVKALQEAMERIETLEQKVADLEGQ